MIGDVHVGLQVWGRVPSLSLASGMMFSLHFQPRACQDQFSECQRPIEGSQFGLRFWVSGRGDDGCVSRCRASDSARRPPGFSSRWSLFTRVNNPTDLRHPVSRDATGCAGCATSAAPTARRGTRWPPTQASPCRVAQSLPTPLHPQMKAASATSTACAKPSVLPSPA